MKQTPILIVAFARIGDIERFRLELAECKRSIYIFVDKSNGKHGIENAEVIELVKTFEKSGFATVRISEVHLGVGLAVPAAIDWVFEHEENIIILEDDCHPNENALAFFDSKIEFLDEKIVMVCGTSPWDLEKSPPSMKCSTTSRHPLISGWGVSRTAWLDLRKTYEFHPRIFKLSRLLRLRIQDFPTFCFFFAAYLRVKKGKLNAWDSPLALEMLLGNKMAIIPNVTLIENTGRDHFASHTLPEINEDRVFRQSSKLPPNQNVDFSNSERRNTEKAIRKNLYHVSLRNLLSPLKALIRP